MANEDGSVKIKVNMDITDVGAGVKDIGAQLKKAGDAAAQAGKAMGKNLSKSKWGYDRDAMEFMDNFGKSLEGSAEAARKVIDVYDKAGVSAENAADSVRKLAEEEREAAEAGAATTGEGVADTIHKQVLSAQKALAELSEQGLGPGDAKWDEAYQAAAQLHAEEKAYLSDLAKTPEQCQREAAAIAKAAARAEELRRKEEARAEAARQQEAAEAAEAQRLAGIAQSAQVSSQAVIRLTQELEQLQARQQELNAAGVGMGYEEYDANAERIRAVTAALREYAATGSDAAAQTLTQGSAQTTAWERFRQKILSAAASLGLVRRQTNDTSGAMKRLRTSAGTAAAGVGSMFKRVLKWGLGIGSVTMLVRRFWSAVKEGLTIMAQHDTETADTLNGLKTALTNVKLSLASAFAPVVTAVAPLLIKLSDLVTKAANAVARFFAILSGKSTYKRAVAAQDAITDSVAGTGAAAKEAAKNLSGLDELNTWQENNAGSGGGGGGAGSGSGVDVEEVETGAATDFEVRLKDILFNWDDLDPELIAEKILTGLCAAAGGIIGWTIGGPLGGLVGLTLGALLGVKLSQVTFDGDGKLDSDEVKGLILTAAGALLGGALGFSIIGKTGKGVAGADVGFSAKAGISMAIAGLLLETTGVYDMTYDGPNLENILRTAIGGALGVAGSLMVFGTGPAGWIVGIGLVLTAAITGSIKAEMDKTQKHVISLILDAENQIVAKGYLSAGSGAIMNLYSEAFQADEVTALKIISGPITTHGPIVVHREPNKLGSGTVEAGMFIGPLENALTFTGAVTGYYNGSAAKSVNVFGYVRTLTAADDLNNIKDMGVYACSTSSLPKNSPFSNAFTMMVLPGSSEESAIIQCCTRFGAAGHTAFRGVNGGVWTGWSEAAIKTDIPEWKNGNTVTLSGVTITALVTSSLTYIPFCLPIGKPISADSVKITKFTGKLRGVQGYLDGNGDDVNLLSGKYSTAVSMFKTIGMVKLAVTKSSGWTNTVNNTPVTFLGDITLTFAASSDEPMPGPEIFGDGAVQEGPSMADGAEQPESDEPLEKEVETV